MVLYDANASKQLDAAVLKTGIHEVLLMMRAASSIFNVVENLTKVDRVISVAGPGSNGGDAHGVAILSAIAGKKTKIYSISEISGESKKIADFCGELGVVKLKSLPEPSEISSDDVIIDGLFGTGLNRPPTGYFADAIDWMNMARRNGAKVIAIDVPSGLNASNGSTPGVAVKADFTVMCLSSKQGCYTDKAPDLCGKLLFANLGIERPENYTDPSAFLIEGPNYGIMNRPRVGHKGSYGNVLVIGGWPPMQGAGGMAGLAALRAGAGKVYVCGPSFPECPLELISIERKLDCVDEILQSMDVVVAGPGLGDGAGVFLEKIWRSDRPLVLDADGLNWLSEANLDKREAEWIGTPHPGEARKLLSENIEDRFTALERLHDLYGGLWVLKGAGTLVGPNPIYVNPFADSILATAGSGDVLAGVIGGLLSQKSDSPAQKGVYIHSKAAELLKAEGRKTIVATDLLDAVSKVITVGDI